MIPRWVLAVWSATSLTAAVDTSAFVVASLIVMGLAQAIWVLNTTLDKRAERR